MMVYRRHALLFLCLGLTLWARAEDTELPRGRSLTASYLELWKDPGVEKASALRLRDYRVLLVTGFLSDAPVSYNRLAGTFTEVGDYYEDQIHWFEANLISHELVRIQTQSGPEVNARAIAKAVRESPQPVILITHSKGGIDGLEALLRYPDIRMKVAGWIAMQAPFHGSPIADFVASKRALRKASNWALKKMGGTGDDSLMCLTQPFRKSYLRRHREEIAELVRETRVLSFASYKLDEPGVDSSLEPTRNLMLHWGYAGDGLVPYQSAILPYSDYITVSGVDHGSPVVYCDLLDYDRVRMTAVLIKLLLDPR